MLLNPSTFSVRHNEPWPIFSYLLYTPTSFLVLPVQDIYYRYVQFLYHLIIIKAKVVLSQADATLAYF